MMNISWAVTVHNELKEVTNLINFLQLYINPDDEIVVQYDEGGVTDEVLSYLKIADKMESRLKVIGFPLNNDFATFKNNLTVHCTKDYVFQLDADEKPHENLVENLGKVLETNIVDLVFIPRVNTVEGLTESHIKKWGWKVNEKGWVQWPDYQTRVYRRTDDIMWMNKVHERITGYNNFSNFPASEEWCIYHHKDIDRQEIQNAYYETL